MKKIVILSAMFILSFVVSAVAEAGVSMKLEGSCKLVQADRSVKAFNYYSSFNGCNNKSTAGISFEDAESLYTGVRSFVGEKDIYAFGDKGDSIRLVFANSTGNTSGTLTYVDDSIENKSPRTRTVKVSCEVRDYEYAECR